MTYTLRFDPDSPIKPIVRTKNYKITCKCGGIIDVKKLLALPISSAGKEKEGWLAVCRQCRATSEVQETWSEAEGRVISNALERINNGLENHKKLKERLKNKKEDNR